MTLKHRQRGVGAQMHLDPSGRADIHGCRQAQMQTGVQTGRGVHRQSLSRRGWRSHLSREGMTHFIHMEGMTMNEFAEITAFRADLLENTGKMDELEDNLVNNGPDILERCQAALKNMEPPPGVRLVCKNTMAWGE